MMGCCIVSGRKFIDSDGVVDRDRLETISNELESRFDGKEIPKQTTECMLAEVQQCDCPCHKDGITCLC